jgi:hypothetical protein
MMPAVTAGVIVTGVPIASYYHHASTGPAWALVDYDHATPIAQAPAASSPGSSPQKPEARPRPST